MNDKLDFFNFLILLCVVAFFAGLIYLAMMYPVNPFLLVR